MAPAFMRSARPRWRVLLRGVVIAALMLLALPYLIVPLYRVVDPVSTLMLWRWATGQRVERVTVPIGRIARVLPLTVINSEDARFCSHHGVDFQGLQDAVADADDGGLLRGGSTITQQLAKNLFLWPGRSFLRKGLEAPLALWIDLVLSKRRALEIYLNVVEWGPNGEFGAEAASRRAFSKAAARLNGREAALLAAVLPNPVSRDARRPGRGLSALARIYERRAARSPVLDVCVRAGSRKGRTL